MLERRKNEVYLANKSIKDLVKKHGTPLYIYDLKSMIQRVRDFKSSFREKVEVHYALKANSHSKILSRFKKEKIGVDIVSWGEAKVALDAGFLPKDIIFSGVGKTKEELKKAIKHNIKQINVESPQELIRIGEIAKKYKAKTSIAFRMNPNVNPKTHPYITTGFRENKFGMDVSFLPELRGILTKFKKYLFLKGLTLHIGSQLLDLEILREAIEKTIPTYLDLRSAGYELETFDVGGGVGIPYNDESPVEIKAYGQMVTELLSPLGCRILAEPGRWIVGPYGALLTEVQYIKKAPFKNFAIVDTGMNHLIRPALYGAFHKISKINEDKKLNSELYDIVGPICESSDFLGKDRYLESLKQGDLLLIYDVGAYGFSMSSHYNHHNLPKEIVL